MRNLKLAIIDYGAGNIHSLYHALNRVSNRNTEIIVTSSSSEIESCDKIILPGVGAFGFCMSSLLKIERLSKVLENAILKDGKPFLGICVGMQILGEYSEESDRVGLSYFPYDIVRMKLNDISSENITGNITLSQGLIRIPHMGWNNVSYTENHPLFKNIPNETNMYFVHSYMFERKVGVNIDSNIVETETYYGVNKIISSIWQDNLYAVQFHPEKSGVHGLSLLRNFVEMS